MHGPLLANYICICFVLEQIYHLVPAKLNLVILNQMLNKKAIFDVKQDTIICIACSGRTSKHIALNT